MKITVICIDCLRVDSVGPRMQGFLDSGLEFTRAYAAGPTTIPSVPTCLTGVPAGEHGMITEGYKILAPTVIDRLRSRGFHTIAHSFNPLAKLREDLFDEWNLHPFLSGLIRIGEPTDDDPLFPGKPWDGMAAFKITQESYEHIWDDIANRKGDLFTYVHFMDAHEPFRENSSVAIDEFPHDYRVLRFIDWVEQTAGRGRDSLTEAEWDTIWKLYRADVKYLDDRLDFPGDIVILMSDHGHLIGEGAYEAHLSHPPNNFLEAQMRVPLGVAGLGAKGVKHNRPFNLMYLPILIEAVLDGKELPRGDDLYWEGLWRQSGIEVHAIKNPECPAETLAAISTGRADYQDKDGKVSTEWDDVPQRMIEMLEERMARAKRVPFHRLKSEDMAIVEKRLRGLGYIE